jgi:hypothetical protein
LIGRCHHLLLASDWKTRGNPTQLKGSPIPSSRFARWLPHGANMPTIISTCGYIRRTELTRALSTHDKDLTKIRTARLNTMTTCLAHARRIHLVGLLAVVAHLRPAAGKRLNVLLIMVSCWIESRDLIFIFSTSLVSLFSSL